jgi:hypothetical protein
MYLYKKGELNPSLFQRVKDHINKCEQCENDWQKIETSEKFTEKLKNYQPVASHSDKLTSDILEAVKMLSIPYQKENKAIFQDMPVQWLTVLKVKMALTTALLLLTLTFVFEYGYILNNISNLEKHIANQTNITAKNNILQSDCFVLLQTIPFTKMELSNAISDYVKDNKFSKNEWITISKKLCRYYKTNQLKKNKNTISKFP